MRFFQSGLVGVLLSAACCAANVSAQALTIMPDAPKVDARHYVLIAPDSGQILASLKADEPTPPASLTKLMTAYITFESLANGTLKLDQQIPISVVAWKAGGSTMFLQPNLPATVSQMISGMVVVSGNDAAVALAEVIAGNSDSFVQMMNATAHQLGMTESHFDNVNGLPTTTHLISARDIGLLSENIIRQFPQYLHFFGDHTFTYNKITQRNWNPLVFSDATVTGMKTGHTDDAGYCLDATAVRNDRPMIAVVMGAHTRNESAKAAEALLDYGYRFFESDRIFKAGQLVSTVHDNNADPAQVQVGVASDAWVTVQNGQLASIKKSMDIPATLPLPLKAGQNIGRLVISEDNRQITEIPLVSLTSVDKAGWFMHGWNMIESAIHKL